MSNVPGDISFSSSFVCRSKLFRFYSWTFFSFFISKWKNGVFSKQYFCISTCLDLRSKDDFFPHQKDTTGTSVYTNTVHMIINHNSHSEQSFFPDGLYQFRIVFTWSLFKECLKTNRRRLRWNARTAIFCEGSVVCAYFTVRWWWRSDASCTKTRALKCTFSNPVTVQWMCIIPSHNTRTGSFLLINHVYTLIRYKHD